MSLPSQIDSPNQLGRPIYLDPRSFGAVGNGIVDDTAAIQRALDAAGTNGKPSIVQLTTGKYLCTTALVFKRNSIILQGTGMSGYEGGSAGFNTAVLVANNAHDNTPMVRISYADGVGFQLQGCIRDITIDVSASSRWNTASASPPVIQLSGVSNSPVFQNIFVYGYTGTGLAIGTSADTFICENLQFTACMMFGGYTSGGGSLGIVPTADGVSVCGADNCQWRGGMIVYNHTSIPLHSDTTDMAGIRLVPCANTGNLINNGFLMIGTIFTRYACTIRLSALNIGGTWFAPQQIRIIGAAAETYGRFVVINEETASAIGFWRSQVEMDHCFWSGPFGGAASRIVTGDHMQACFIRLQYLGKTADLTLGSDTDGVVYEIGVNPNGVGSFFGASDLGRNTGTYIKPGLVGRIVTGQSRFMAGIDPTAANSGTGTQGMQNYGDTFKAFNNPGAPGSAVGRNITHTGNAGVNGDFTVGFDPGTAKWYLFICVVDNNWGRVALDFAF